MATDGLRRQVRELRRRMTDEAEMQAAKVFSSNLRALILQRPVRGCVILGIDPGYRYGCKLAVIDAEGRVCAHGGLMSSDCL